MTVRPVYGYRCWDLGRDDRGFVLKSLSGLAWTSPVMGPARNRARVVAPLATRSGDAWQAGDNAPGFYAVKDTTDLDTQAHRYLSGVVRLWGTVVEHERGWRAEHAQVVGVSTKLRCLFWPCPNPVTRLFHSFLWVYSYCSLDRQSHLDAGCKNGLGFFDGLLAGAELFPVEALHRDLARRYEPVLAGSAVDLGMFAEHLKGERQRS